MKITETEENRQSIDERMIVVLKNGQDGNSLEKVMTKGPVKTGCCGLEKRFCGKRLSACGLSCTIITLIMIMILIVMIPVTYCILVPKTIQAKVDTFLTSSDILIPLLDTSRTANLSFFPLVNTFTFGSQSFIPGTVTLVGSTSFYQSINLDGSKPWSRLDVPSDISIALNQNNNISFSSDLFILDIAAATGLFFNPITPVYITSNWKIRFWGITWYNNLSIKSQVSLQSGAGESLLQVALRGLFQ